ncbi:DNA polymerase [Sphingomonas sp.]|uniref:DNA polymerase n=1 Tax=Sphingomonas sp. TaxID=28214 RepID=UPI002ED9B33D
MPLICDLESDGLLDELTRIHTLHVIDHATGNALRFNNGFFADGSPAPRDGTLEDALALIEAADVTYWHNGIRFDIPAITKLYPSFRPRGHVRDTMLLAQIAWPHLSDIDAAAISKNKRPEGFGKFVGRHSLEAWGHRLGVHKGDYKGGWEHFTQEMESYAAQDVVVTRALLELIESKNLHPETVELEHRVAEIIHMQERFGFAFDDGAAEKLEITLRGCKAELEDRLREAFPPWQEPERKGGRAVQFVPKRDNAKLGYQAGVAIQRFKTVSFNPASRDHISNRMMALHGWEPVEFTDGGKPKVDETTLDGLDVPEAKLLVEYLTIDKRLGQLAEGAQAWRKRVTPAGRIHGRVNTLGAITRRMTHSYPNVAQVPSLVNASGPVPYGKDCRALFGVAPGNKLVGCDAESLELRMLAHYMARFDGGAYADTVVNGDKDAGTDVHTVNQKLIGLNSRSSAKTWIYAYLYGAGNLKLGTVIYEDMPAEERAKFNAKHPAGQPRERALVRIGKLARDSIEAGLPALGRLQEIVKGRAASGLIKTVDGGMLRIRSAHAALNTLLQGGGAVVMKKALVVFADDLVDRGFEPDILSGSFSHPDGTLGFVANVHDEFQMEVPEHLAETIGRLAADSIRLAGEAYGLRCPLAGAYQIGDNWSDSH